jgi:hypothetical protein
VYADAALEVHVLTWGEELMYAHRPEQDAANAVQKGLTVFVVEVVGAAEEVVEEEMLVGLVDVVTVVVPVTLLDEAMVVEVDVVFAVDVVFTVEIVGAGCQKRRLDNADDEGEALSRVT